LREPRSSQNRGPPLDGMVGRGENVAHLRTRSFDRVKRTLVSRM
jgi:hypothetical protein